MKQSFKESIEKLQLPVITLDIMGIEMNFLIDSGSNRNHVSDRAFDILKGTDLYKNTFSDYREQTQLTGIGGGSSIQEQVALGYFLDGRGYASRFGIMSDDIFDSMAKECGIKLSGILGTNFLLCHNIVIDYAQMMIYSPNEQN